MGTVAHSRPNTVRLYRDMLGPFAAHFRSKRLEELTPDMCIRFVSGYRGTGYKGKTFGDSSRALMFRYIKTLFKSARDTGIIQLNPLARVPNPWKIRAHERPMTEEEYLLIMADRKLNDRFKEVLEIMWRTGARPGEVAKLAARHLNAPGRSPGSSPPSTRPGRRPDSSVRSSSPPDLMDRLRKYAEVRPKGPLLRNRAGKPWTQDLISDTFGRVKRRLGLPPDCVIYMARHGFITRLVESGAPLAHVAKLAGHTHPETVMQHYYHPETMAMLEDVAKINEGEAEKLEGLKRRVLSERKEKRSALIEGEDSTNPTVS